MDSAFSTLPTATAQSRTRVFRSRNFLKSRHSSPHKTQAEGHNKTRMKYSDLLAEWLAGLGYTHCFFVAGGNIMHLLESCSHWFTCIPVVHEVAAGVGAEYFDEVHLGAKAFALVTAGPGLTNIVTALAGAFVESRE